MLTGDAAGEVVFLLDVDNTLLDNDRFSADLDAELVRAFGEPGRARYRAAYERLRDTHGYADYLGAVQALREDRLVDEHALLQLGDFLLDYPFDTLVYPGSADERLRDTHGYADYLGAVQALREDRLVDEHALLQLGDFLLDYPFDTLVYPGSADAIAHVATLGVPVILSDGDLVFQPRKIRRAGLWDAVHGRVLLSVHKERMLDAVQEAYPARHYVVVDDKPKVLQAIKEALGARVTTVFVHQGHYAREADLEHLQPPDLSLAHIGELVGLDTGKDVLLHRSLALIPDLSPTPP